MNRSITVELIADVTRFNAGMGQALSGLMKFGDKAQQVGTALSVGLSAPLGILGKKAIDAYGEMDALTRGLATLEKSAQSLQTRLATLQEVAKLPGLGYKEAIQFDISLRSAGFSADLSKRSMLAFGNALGSIGKGKNELKGVSLQLQQLATKTGGFGADIRVIKEYAPQVGAALQAAFGTTNTEAIAKMGVTGKQVVEKIVGELEKLPKATGGIKNAFENLEDSTFRSLAKLGESLNNALGIEGLVNKLGSTIAGLVNWFTELSPAVQTIVAGLGALLVIIPPLIAAVGFFSTTILPAMTAGLIALGGPITWTVAAIAAAATLIALNWDKVKKVLTDTGVWTTLVGIVNTSMALVKSVFSAGTLFAQVLWDRFGGFIVGAARTALQAVVAAFNFGAGALTGIFKALTGILTLDWRMAMTGLLDIAKTVWNLLIDGFKLLASVVARTIAATFQLFGGDTIANKLTTGIDKALTKLDRLKGKITALPGVSLGSATKPDPFAGLNFAKPGTKDGNDLVAGDGKKSKTYVAETYLEKLQHQLSEVEDTIRQFGAKGLTIPEKLREEYAKLTDQLKKADDALKSLQRTDINGVSKLQSNDVIKTKYTKYSQSDKPVAFSMAPKLPGVEKFNEIQKVAKRVSRTMVDLNKDIQDNLRQAAESAFVGMGEVIGGLLSGTAGLSDLPKLLLGVLGGLLEQLGRMAIAVGLGVQAIQTALKTLNPFVAIAAGIGLIALGALVKSGSAKMAGGGVKGFEKGGLFTGESTIRVAESSKARQGGGEWVSPIGVGADLISDRIMDNMSSMVPSINPQSQKPVQQNYQLGNETLSHRISGSDIMLILERAGKSQKAFGNG